MFLIDDVLRVRPARWPACPEQLCCAARISGRRREVRDMYVVTVVSNALYHRHHGDRRHCCVVIVVAAVRVPMAYTLVPVAQKSGNHLYNRDVLRICYTMSADFSCLFSLHVRTTLQYIRSCRYYTVVYTILQVRTTISAAGVDSTHCLMPRCT